MPESNPLGSPSTETYLKQSSSERLRWALGVDVGSYFKSVEVVGKNNLKLLESGKPVIIVTTHISDQDLPLAAWSVCKDLDIAITDLSIHRSFSSVLKSSDTTIGGMLIAGIDNFLPIQYVEKNRMRVGRINPDDLDRIRHKLKENKAVVIAAHNPVFDSKLPSKFGFVAVRMAQSVRDVVVLPVAVDVTGKSKFDFGDLIKKRTAKVIFGKPVTLDDPDAKKAGDKIESLFKKASLDKGDREAIHQAREIFANDGAKLMRALASLLPQEKQGVWFSKTD